MAESADLSGLLTSIGLRDVQAVATALRDLGIEAPSDFDTLDDGLWAELDDGLKAAGVSLGDRGRLRKLRGGDGKGVATSAATTSQQLPVGPLPKDLRELRQVVAAVGAPDEGMRGTAADGVKLHAASDADTLAVLAAGLRGRSADVAAAAATVRSIAITGAAAASACDRVATPLCEAAKRPRPTCIWPIVAILRLAQHRESQVGLIRAGAVQTLAAYTRIEPGNPRLDLLAGISLALLSETAGASAVLHVPLRAVPEFVALLRKCLFADGPEDIVAQRLFCGLPLHYRPRFVVQALARLAEHSGAHAAVAWRTALPELLCGFLEGTFPDDAAQNRPYGSPDVVEMAAVCAEALLKCGDGTEDARDALNAVLKKSKL